MRFFSNFWLLFTSKPILLEKLTLPLSRVSMIKYWTQLSPSITLSFSDQTLTSVFAALKWKPRTAVLNTSWQRHFEATLCRLAPQQWQWGAAQCQIAATDTAARLCPYTGSPWSPSEGWSGSRASTGVRTGDPRRRPSSAPSTSPRRTSNP